MIIKVYYINMAYLYRRIMALLFLSVFFFYYVKYLQASLQYYRNRELPDVQAVFRKGRGTRNQVANICWIIKKQESFRKTSTSVLLTMPKPLTAWITKLWKILKEIGIPDHLTCLLRNLYAGQEATVRTGHGTTDWFQIGKEVR